MRFSTVSATDVDGDVFVGFVSYEQRSLSVLTKLSERGFLGRVILFHNLDFDSPTKQQRIEQVLEMRPDAELVAVAIRDSSEIVREVTSRHWPANLTLDISCFNRQNLFCFLWALRLGREYTPTMTIGYCGAEKYGPWLSRDYQSPRNILGFSGTLLEQPKRHLVCCVGFESDRALAVIEYLEPFSITLAVGSDPTKEEFIHRNRTSLIEVAGGQSRYNVTNLSVLDPDACGMELAAIVNDVDPDQSLHIAPFNTKLSCLSVFAIWSDRRDIRVWNAQPESYNIGSYSIGAKEPQFFNVDWDRSFFG